jgi:hypothetical protein|nr:MAG TPA: hypothetical protein [Caudoviricetes sp.]
MTQKQGLQVFDASGNPVVDVTTDLPAVLGEIRTGGSNGSVNIGDIGGRLWYIIRPAFSSTTKYEWADDYYNASKKASIKITYENGILSYTYTTPGLDALIIYGRY